MWRLLNFIVILALIVGAAWVYRIKYSATRQAERVAKLHVEVRRERDAIAMLRAEWAQLDNPDRIQRLAARHLNLRTVDPYQFDQLASLPDKPVQIVPPGTADPIGALIEKIEKPTDPDVMNGTQFDPEADR